ncbi:hypothetical protein Tco_0602434 [Tanacetum coccineum]
MYSFIFLCSLVEETYPSFRDENDEVMDLFCVINVCGPDSGEGSVREGRVLRGEAEAFEETTGSGGGFDFGINQNIVFEGSEHGRLAETEIVSRRSTRSPKEKAPAAEQDVSFLLSREKLMDTQYFNLLKSSVCKLYPTLLLFTSSVSSHRSERMVMILLMSVVLDQPRILVLRKVWLCPRLTSIISIKVLKLEVESIPCLCPSLIMTTAVVLLLERLVYLLTYSPRLLLILPRGLVPPYFLTLIPQTLRGRLLLAPLSVSVMSFLWDPRVGLEALHKIFVPRWNVPNDTLLDEHDISHEFIDHLAPPVLFSQIRNMDYHHLFTEFNVGTARQACLNAVEGGGDWGLKAQLTVKEAEAAESIRLRAQIVAMERVHNDEVNVLQHNNAVLESEKNTLNDKVMELQNSSCSAKDFGLRKLGLRCVSPSPRKIAWVDQVNVLEGACFELREQVSAYESLKEQIEEFQDEQMRVMFDKLAKLEVDLIEMALHLEEKFYPHLLIVIAACRWLLTHGLKLFITKCLNSSEYLVALGAAISRAIEKGMQVGLAAEIEHVKQGRRLEELVAYNPSAKEDYDTAIKELCAVEFSLLADLKSNKDASTKTIMNLLRLNDPLSNLPGMSDLQPDVEQVERIRRNIVEHRSALAGVFAPLVEPFSVQSLAGAVNTSDAAPSAAATTTALSTTFASAITIPPVSVDDYVVADVSMKRMCSLTLIRRPVSVDDYVVADVVDEENVQPNVDKTGEGSSAADINFKKEELDTTP